MDVTILLPYGVFQESNLQYKKYLDEALTNISDEQVIVCGGSTNKDIQISESKSVSDYLVKVRPELQGKIWNEDTSITTPQNLEFAYDILKTKSVTPDTIKIICDSIRISKVYYFALTYFSDASEEQIYTSLLAQFVEKPLDVTQNSTLAHKNISVVGISLGRAPVELGQQITSTLLEVGAAKYPTLETDIIARRKKLWGIT